MWEANWKYVLTIPASMMSIFLVLMLVPDIGRRTRSTPRNAGCMLPCRRPRARAPRMPATHEATAMPCRARSQRPAQPFRPTTSLSRASSRGEHCSPTAESGRHSNRGAFASLRPAAGAVGSVDLAIGRGEIVRRSRPQRRRQDDAVSPALDADSAADRHGDDPGLRPAPARRQPIRRASASCSRPPASTAS